MAYIALYRNYRPADFNEVAGQKYIIKTLKNAVINNRISHAYIFSGQRGIGKTTIARILAKAVNCLKSTNGEPCNECANCQAISKNETPDIIEIDAASNNGVDEMRSLLEKVNFLPSTLKKKVYIIDEVHMLSISAFNALLKTLEEPPAHVMFILATTEPHKIPMTILSRCQRFDFKQLSNQEIIERLQEICKQEDILIEEEALMAIAETSEGGMRDAVSTLDQVNSYAVSKITVDDVNSVTGRISNYKLIDLLRSFYEHDAFKALKIIDELLSMGKEINRLTNNLIQFCRDILLYKNAVETGVKKNIYNSAEFKELADLLDTKTLFYYIDILMDTANKLKFTNSGKIYLEVAIMKIVSTYKEDLDLLGKIAELEEKISGGVTVTSKSISNDVEIRLAELELKVKKVIEDLVRLNLNEFKETTVGKLALLEEVSTSSAAIPKDIGERIENLENVVALVNSNSQSETVTTGEVNQIKYDEITSKLSEIEAKLQDNSQNLYNEEKYNEIITRVNVLESIKASSQEEQLVDSNFVNELKQKIKDIDLNIDQITNQIIEFEDKIQNNSSVNEPKFENVNINIDEYIQEVNELRENYFTVIEKIQQFVSKDELEESSSSQEEQANNQTLYDSILKDALDALDLVKQELDTKILENTHTMLLLTKRVDEISDNIKDINYDQKIESINEKIVTIDNKILTISNNNIEDKIKDIYTYVDDLKNYNLKLSLKFQELQKTLEENKNELAVEKEIESAKVVEETKEKIEVEKEQIVKEEPKVFQQEPIENTSTTVIAKGERITSNNITLNVKDVNETSKVYDIRIVERILHESRHNEMREEKANLTNNWSKLANNAGPILIANAKMLRDGTLIANGQKELLIVYPLASICNHLMSPKVHQEAREILKITFGKDYDFIALPENTWQEKRKEYYGQYSMGIKYPKLSPINNPELRAIIIKEEKEQKNGTYDRAVSFFGSKITRKEE